MRNITIAVGLSSLFALGGCGSSSTVSQYAGLPAYELPRDHVQYRPRQAARQVPAAAASTASVEPAPDPTLPREESARLLALIQSENERLSRLTTICSKCLGKPAPAPSYARSIDTDFARIDSHTRAALDALTAGDREPAGQPHE